MAKNIKVIKCPQCGSTKVTELKPDYYQCKSCGTEFFLDSDDININHNYNYTNSKPDSPVAGKKIGIIIGAIFLIFALIPFLISVFSSHKETNYSAYSSTAAERSRYQWDTASDINFVDSKGNPYYVAVGSMYDNEASGDNRKMKGAYLVLYDGKTSEQKMIKKLSDENMESISDIHLRIFEDKNLYIITNYKRVFRLNANDLSSEELTDQYKKENTDLAVGFAKLEFIYKNYGSGYDVIANDGRILVYMPFINKTYTKDQFYEAKKAKLPQPIEKTSFAFSTKSSEYPDEKLELVKYKFDYQMGYPKDEPRFEWRKDYGGSGIFTDRDPYTKYFATKGDGRLNSFIDLTPGRIYFAPEVVDFTDTELLVAIKSTPAEDENYQLQVLNPDNGSILKTIPVKGKYFYDPGFILKDGYFVKLQETYFIDKTGKIINTIKGYYDMKISDAK